MWVEYSSPAVLIDISGSPATASSRSVSIPAHLAFAWELHGSTGTTDPILLGLPTEMTVTYGPYAAVAGFLLVIAGSAVAAASAKSVLLGRARARMGARD